MEERKWEDVLETGDPCVDRQHEEIHQLLDYVESVDDRPEEVLHVLDRLMAHVDGHFATEEALMRRCGYSGDAARAHIADHHQLTQSAREMVLLFRSGELTSTKPLVTFLRGWLEGHVHGHDVQFIAFAKAAGSSAEASPPAG